MIDRTEEEIRKNWNATRYGNRPLVSIACKTYNQEKYIEKCLDGFLEQETNFPFEIIVHDDASTDSTATIVRRYEQRFPHIIRPIYEKENQYSKRDGSLRRIVHQACTGKYIASCEGDDYWINPHKLQMQFDAMEEHSECSICVGLVKLCDENGVEIRGSLPPAGFGVAEMVQSVVLTREHLAKIYWEYGEYMFQTSSYMYRLDSLLPEESEYKSILRRDRGMLRQAFLTGECYYINVPLSTYRKNVAGSWNNKQSALGNKGILKWQSENFEMDWVMNILTNGAYENKIIIELFRCIYNMACWDSNYSIPYFQRLSKAFPEEKILDAIDGCSIETTKKMLHRAYCQYKRNPVLIQKQFERKEKWNIKKRYIKGTKFGTILVKIRNKVEGKN